MRHVSTKLYNSLSILLGDKKYNLLFENSLSDEENLISQFHKKIQNIRNEDDIILIYNQIYDLYDKKIEENMKIDENIDYLFRRYSK